MIEELRQSLSLTGTEGLTITGLAITDVAAFVSETGLLNITGVVGVVGTDLDTELEVVSEELAVTLMLPAVLLWLLLWTPASPFVLSRSCSLASRCSRNNSSKDLLRPFTARRKDSE